jgi:hypothetical protein
MPQTKQIKCSRCDKTVEVPDDYSFKRCELCRAKDKARNLKNSEVRRELRKFDRDSKIQIKGLNKLPDFARSYSAFKRWYEKMFHDKPCTWDDYLKLIDHFRNRQAQEQSRIEISRRKHERSEEKILNALDFPFESEDCKTYRIFRAKEKRSFEESDFIASHILKCKVCTDWLQWFKVYQDESESREGDTTQFDKPLSGANAWDTSNEPEESYEDEVKRKGLTNDFKRSTDELIEKDLDRSEFADSNQDFRKIRQKEKGD